VKHYFSFSTGDLVFRDNKPVLDNQIGGQSASMTLHLLESPSVINTNETIGNKMAFDGSLTPALMVLASMICFGMCMFGLICNIPENIWARCGSCCCPHFAVKHRNLKRESDATDKMADEEGFDNVVMTERDAPIATEPGTAID